MAAPSSHVLGIDPKMYRHFAALTLVITLCIAFLTNGGQSRVVPGGTEAAADQPGKKAKRPRSEMDVLNGVPEDPAPARATSAPPPPSSAGIDEVPFELRPNDDGQFHPPPFAYHRAAPRPDAALLAKMTPEQRAAYLKAMAMRDQQMQAEAGGPGGDSGPGAGPSQSQINSLVAASRARSGGGGGN